MAKIFKPAKKKYYQRSDNERRQERQKIYQSTEWQMARRSHLAAHPLCELCEAEGRVTAAIDVHHKDSFMRYDGVDRWYMALDYRNLQSLCKRCHQRIHNSRRCTELPNNLKNCE
jgi:5-methylcytosine-specific restriction protein A